MSNVHASARARALLDLRRPAQAIALLREALAQDPDDADLLLLLGRAHLLAHRPAEALAAADAALAQQPARVSAHVLRCYALVALGRGAEAVAAGQESVRLAPQHSSGYLALTDALVLHPLPVARGLARAGRTPTLLAAQRAAELSPDLPLAHLGLARAYAQTADWRRARAASDRALALAPDDASIHNDVAALWFKQGPSTSAARGFARAAAMDPAGVSAANFVGACRARVAWAMFLTALAFWWLTANECVPFSTASIPGVRTVAGNLLAAVLVTPTLVLGFFVLRLPARVRGAAVRAVRSDRGLLARLEVLAAVAVAMVVALALGGPAAGRIVGPIVGLGLLATHVVAFWVFFASARRRRSVITRSPGRPGAGLDSPI